MSRKRLLMAMAAGLGAALLTTVARVGYLEATADRDPIVLWIGGARGPDIPSVVIQPEPAWSSQDAWGEGWALGCVVGLMVAGSNVFVTQILALAEWRRERGV